MKNPHRVEGLIRALDEPESVLKARTAALFGLREGDLDGFRILRKSLDARRSRPPRFVYAVACGLPDATGTPVVLPEGVSVHRCEADPDDAPGLAPPRPSPGGRKPVGVIGGGPAGLFAALRLALAGRSVILLERGRPVSLRVRDVERFWAEGAFDPESHVQFGEGGAGTFSDGKLTSRARNPRAGWVKRVLVDCGAPDAILTDAKPHIGTDRLRAVVVRLRERLRASGCEVRFGARVTDVLVRRGRLVGLVVGDREEIRIAQAILAPGQSADDTLQRLRERGVALAPKAFAVGLRVEHPQALIDEIQYGPWRSHPALPPAEYALTARLAKDDRSVYTFCMCPGGRVIACSAAAGGVITNGMSLSRRDGAYANSAVVVNVRTEDFAPDPDDPLAGLAFRRLWEARAFAVAGGAYRAPAQRLTDFLVRRVSPDIPETTFRPGVTPVPLHEVLPRFVGASLVEGLRAFDRRMPGFVTAEAVLIGVETRTSSPVRILRGGDGQSVSVRGLYPCGEGAGYAGGIVSSALDGLRAAERLLEAAD